ncbi:MAG TPA: class I SAM-dependent methyltransferase [Rubrobacteraceae bacterium]|nr:class I SAM-dependent methyltransferase [Rubrobacteraceae bacterium]
MRKVYEARNDRELAEGYDAWAGEYEGDVSSFGYKIPAVVTGLAGRYLDRGGRLLDAGAGTGVLGEILHLLGYTDLTGIDLSEGMLEKAREKGIYGSLRRMALGERLDFLDGAFDATLSSGVFTTGHAPPESLREISRVTRPGGHVIFSVRETVYLEGGFGEEQESLEREGRWRLVEQTGTFQSLPLGEPEVLGRVFVYEVS